MEKGEESCGETFLPFSAFFGEHVMTLEKRSKEKPAKIKYILNSGTSWGVGGWGGWGVATTKFEKITRKK